MKALVLDDFGSAPTFRDVPLPEPSRDQVRIRVKTAGLNKFDTTIASGMLKGMMEYRFPVVLGRDASGVIDAVGDGVDDIRPGDHALGHMLMDGTLHHGTLSEFAVLPAEGVVRMPDKLDFDAAAALPLAAAAAHGTVDAIGATSGSTVLIVGASGGVGSYAIQLAVLRDASVIATGRSEDVDRLLGLGAAEVIDWSSDIVQQVTRIHPEGVDALIDLVHYDASEVTKLASIVRDGGHVVSSLRAVDAEALAARGLSGTNVTADPSRNTLTLLINEIESGTLRVDIEEVLPFDQVMAGLDKLANGGAKGKIVVRIDS